MADRLWDLCEAIAAALNGQTWAEEATASVAVLPVQDLINEVLYLRVLPASDSDAVVGRSVSEAALQSEYEVDLVVQQKFAACIDDTARVKALAAFCAALKDFLLDDPISLTGAKAWCTRAGREQAYSPDDLMQFREFFCVVSTTWLTIAS